MKKKTHIFLLGIVLLFLILGVSISKDYQLNQFSGKAYAPSNWVLENMETGSLEEVSLPYSLSFDGSYQYALRTKIDDTPDDNAPPYLFLSMNHSYFRVLLDDEELYRYTEELTPNLSKSPGNVYTAIALPEQYNGKTLRIEFTLTLEKGLTYLLSDIFFSDYPSAIHQMFVDDLLHDFIITAILLIGIILLLVSLFSFRKSFTSDAFFIGLFALFVGLYGLTESMFNLYMLENPYLSYLINFLVFAAVPAPILAFYRHKVSPFFRPFYAVGLLLISLNVALQILFHFTGIADIRQMLIFTHILYFASFLLAIISVLKSSKQECADKKLLILLLLPILLGGIVDALLHYFFAGISIRNTAFAQIGILATLLIASGYLVRNIMQAYREQLNAQTYKLMAFKDALTGIYNRTAYNEELALLSKSPQDNENIICICVDMNGLKQINDSGGHLLGDQMIQQTARTLESTFCNYGKVFRIGGDEFTALLYNLTEDTLLDILKSMKETVAEYNRTQSPKLSFSVGYELLKNIDNRDINECFRRADMKMYAEKEKWKQAQCRQTKA